MMLLRRAGHNASICRRYIARGRCFLLLAVLTMTVVSMVGYRYRLSYRKLDGKTHWQNQNFKSLDFRKSNFKTSLIGKGPSHSTRNRAVVRPKGLTKVDPKAKVKIVGEKRIEVDVDPKNSDRKSLWETHSDLGLPSVIQGDGSRNSRKRLSTIIQGDASRKRLPTKDKTVNLIPKTKTATTSDLIQPIPVWLSHGADDQTVALKNKNLSHNSRPDVDQRGESQTWGESFVLQKGRKIDQGTGFKRNEPRAAVPGHSHGTIGWQEDRASKALPSRSSVRDKMPGLNTVLPVGRGIDKPHIGRKKSGRLSRDKVSLFPKGNGSESARQMGSRAGLSLEDILQKMPFRNTRLPLDERINDLVRRMEVSELVSQIQAVPGQPTPGVPRLGVKPWVWNTDCSQGLANSTGTVFPVPVAMAATFSKEMVRNVSTCIGREVRAHWNAKVRTGRYQDMYGLICMGPVGNLLHHPLWAGNQDTYGEDPYLAGQLVDSVVRGLQGARSRYVQVGAICRDFAVYSGPVDKPPSGNQTFNARVTDGDLPNTFLPAFRKCVAAGALGIMCANNKLNGVPMCTHSNLLKAKLRHIWRFPGFIMSAKNAVFNLQHQHGNVQSPEDAAVLALRSGCNLDYSSAQNISFHSLIPAFQNKRIDERLLRNNIKPLLRARMRLGDFDPPSMNPYAKINMSVVQSTYHRSVALRAAMMSITLLKNVRGFLPIRQQAHRVVLIGAVANNTSGLLGGFRPRKHRRYIEPLYRRLSKLGDTFTLETGCGDVLCMTYNETKVKVALTGADLVIIAVSSGSRDRASMANPGYSYQSLIRGAIRLTAKDVPIVVLVFSGTPVDLGVAQRSDRVRAILQCFHPGQAGARAVYNVLTATGKHSVPAGRLPFTWPQHLDKVAPVSGYGVTGQTYRFTELIPLYPFGYGLSYSRFEYSQLRVSPQVVVAGKNLSVSVTVVNHGPYDADEVVQVYIQWKNVVLQGLAKLQLIDFRRIWLVANERKTCVFTVTRDDLLVWVNHKSGYRILPVEMSVYAGGQQPGQLARVTSNVLETGFRVVPETKSEHGLPINRYG